MKTGEFWISNAPELKVPGFIELGPRRHALTLLAPLAGDSIRELLTDESKFLIHGRLEDGKKISFVGAYALNSTNGVREEIESDYVLIGAHQRPDSQFVQFRVKLHNLDGWVRTPGLSQTLSWETQGFSFDRWESDIAPIEDGATLQIESSATVGVVPFLSGRINITTQFLIRTDQGCPYLDAWRKWIAPLTTALALTSGHGCPVVALEIQDSDGRWSTVHEPRIRTPENAARLGDYLMHLDDVGIGALAAWLVDSRKLSPIPEILSDSIGSASAHMQRDLIEMTVAADGLYERIDATVEPQVNDEEFVAIKTAAKAATEDRHLQSRIEGILNMLKAVSYKKRIEYLQAVATAIMPNITGTSAEQQKKWVNGVVKWRNSMAHVNKDATKVASPESWRQVNSMTATLRYVLWLILLRKLGVDVDVLRERCEAFVRFYYVLENARYGWPEVYGPPGGGAAPVEG